MSDKDKSVDPWALKPGDFFEPIKALAIGALIYYVGEDVTAFATSAGATEPAKWRELATQSLGAALHFLADRGRTIYNRLTNRERALVDAGIDVKPAGSDPAFQDLVMKAIRIGVSDSRLEKHRLLANAVANAAMSAPNDADRLAILMKLVDDLTPTHVRLLDFLESDDPQDWFKARGLVPPAHDARLHDWMVLVVPNASEGLMLHRVWDDLGRQGFFSEPADVVWQRWKRITMLGMSKEFLRFVRTPPGIPEVD